MLKNEKSVYYMENIVYLWTVNEHRIHYFHLNFDHSFSDSNRLSLI